MSMMHERPPVMERSAKEGLDAIPPLEVQKEFLRVALEQGDGLPYRPKAVKGTHLAGFSGIMQDVGQQLQALHPSLTPECIAPVNYQPPEISARLSRLGRDMPHVTQELEKLRHEHRQALENFARERMMPFTEEQSLPAGLLSVPPHLRQAEQADCVGACWRMVHEGIAGWAPPQDLLNSQLVKRYKTMRVDDEVLLRLFQTDTFKHGCGKTITAFEFLGADLAQIARISANAKERLPGSDIFCTVYQLSKTAKNPHTLHQNVLLSAEDGVVTTHDPKEEDGAFYQQPYEEFATRWAAAYNRAHVVVAR